MHKKCIRNNGAVGQWTRMILHGTELISFDTRLHLFKTRWLPMAQAMITSMVRVMIYCGIGLVDGFPRLRSDEAGVRAIWSESAVRISLVGSAKNDWFLESSTHLTNWVRDPDATPLASGPEGLGPERSITLGAGRTTEFLRAVRTGGLFDDTFIRTFHLRFSQPNWNALLVQAHGTDSNVVCRLESDNGQVMEGVGARYKGFSSFAPDRTKNSLNLTLDYLNPTNRLLGYETVNLNNAWGDPTLLREAVYFGVFTRYAPGPRAGIAQLFINGKNRGVYSLAQQENSDLIREWFPSASGDRWRTPNKGASSLQWISTNLVDYQEWYELKTSANATNAWRRLMQAIEVLNHTPPSQRLGVLDGYFAVDSWLWFLVLENLFVEDDSYWHKGADYSFYFEPESGRIHPLQHDGNEAFVSSFAELSPVYGEADPERPLLSQLLSVPEWRQRYLAHMRTVLDESFNPGVLTPWIDRLAAMSEAAILADPIRPMSDLEYRDGLKELKQFVTNRYSFLRQHAELNAVPLVIQSVSSPPPPTPSTGAVITATVRAAMPGQRVGSVWLHYRQGVAGRFESARMSDNGTGDDAVANDGTYTARTPAYPAGTKVRYYVEARAADMVGTARFFPARTERAALGYSVATGGGGSLPVRINELVADNGVVLRDPQGDFDDYVELRNLSQERVSLAGCYLSDDPARPRKWVFPSDAVLKPEGYLLVWLDEDTADSPGLHANFKLNREGETLWLVDRDDRFNALLDTVTFGPLARDQAWGRSASQNGTFRTMPPSPGMANP